MSRNYNSELAYDQQRLTLSITIIASAIGIYSINSGNKLIEILKLFILLPSLLSGFYVIFTAAHMKYNNPAEIGVIAVTEKLRRGTYDASINMFWIMFLLYVVIFTASLSGWSGKMETFLQFLPSFIISFCVLAVVMILMALARQKELEDKK